MSSKFHNPFHKPKEESENFHIYEVKKKLWGCKQNPVI